MRFVLDDVFLEAQKVCVGAIDISPSGTNAPSKLQSMPITQGSFKWEVIPTELSSELHHS